MTLCCCVPAQAGLIEDTSDEMMADCFDEMEDLGDSVNEEAQNLVDEFLGDSLVGAAPVAPAGGHASTSASASATASKQLKQSSASAVKPSVSKKTVKKQSQHQDETNLPPHAASFLPALTL